jgi:hypothetical protein
VRSMWTRATECRHYNCERRRGVDLEQFWVCKACQRIVLMDRRRPLKKKWANAYLKRGLEALRASGRIAAILFFAHGAALAAEPFPAGGGWWTCPTGTLIYHGRCLPAAEGPVVEYGCTVRENARGEVIGQSCPSGRVAWVGNVGSQGGAVGAAAVGSFGIVVSTTRVGR